MGAGRWKQVRAVAIALAVSVSCTAERKDGARPQAPGVAQPTTAPPVTGAAAPKGGATTDAESEMALGRAARDEGRLANAAVHFERVVRADPGATEARLALADVLLQQSIDLGRVRMLLDEAQALRPEDLRADRLRGWLDELQGDPAAAAADYGRVLEKAPDFDLRVRRANLLLRSSQPDAAVQEFERAAAERPDDRAVRETLAEVYEDHGRMGDAEAMLLEVTRLAPSDPGPQRRLAAFFRRHGQVTQAEQAEARARGLEGAPRALRPLRPPMR